ncbi:MAG: hypothetical protein AB7R89_26315 [Dehalococcoidia bacterium]
MSNFPISRFHQYVLAAGIIGGVILALTADTLTRSDVITPVLAIGLTAPLGWVGMELLGRVRANQSRPSEPSDDEAR